MTRGLHGVLAGLLAIALVSPAAALAASAGGRASFTQIESEVMCVVCHEPLAVAQSPEAFQERDYIRGLVNQGKSRREIENDLVQQYGPAVLAKPPAHGFNLLVYLIPPVAVILGIATVAVTLPRWRRRTSQAAARAAAAPRPAGPAFSAADARRLDEDLKREF
ncbi:MAG TPA: cytochrome c-type biogenesis protein [Solirubrobacteraceae bacterium]|nr:cytochrome c-type biogenesis protein [Solirubrobacteraceae bacterium]